MTIKQIEYRAEHAGLLVGEFAFVGGSLLAAMLVSIVILGSLNPLDSPVITSIFAAVALMGFAHHLWYRRHRQEVESSREHHEARERRGF